MRGEVRDGPVAGEGVGWRRLKWRAGRGPTEGWGPGHARSAPGTWSSCL